MAIVTTSGMEAGRGRDNGLVVLVLVVGLVMMLMVVVKAMPTATPPPPPQTSRRSLRLIPYPPSIQPLPTLQQCMLVFTTDLSHLNHSLTVLNGTAPQNFSLTDIIHVLDLIAVVPRLISHIRACFVIPQSGMASPSPSPSADSLGNSSSSQRLRHVILSPSQGRGRGRGGGSQEVVNQQQPTQAQVATLEDCIRIFMEDLYGLNNSLKVLNSTGLENTTFSLTAAIEVLDLITAIPTVVSHMSRCSERMQDFVIPLSNGHDGIASSPFHSADHLGSLSSSPSPSR